MTLPPFTEEKEMENSSCVGKEAKHTPGPWFVGETRARGQEVWIDTAAPEPHLGYTHWSGLAVVHGCDDNPTLGAEVALANARRIVHCVNTHDELVAALGHIATGGENWNDCVRRARAALATATRSERS